jgi:hypothetical protein
MQTWYHASPDENRVNTCQDHYGKLKKTKFLVITDDMWVYAYDSETKQQSSQWKSPSFLHALPPKRQDKSKSIQIWETRFFIDI